jgi:hypothetical protein
MTLLQWLLDALCGFVRFSNQWCRPRMIKRLDERKIAEWIFVMESAHKTLTGPAVADPIEQATRERHAQRVMNGGIKALSNYFNRGEELQKLPLYLTRQDVWD